MAVLVFSFLASACGEDESVIESVKRADYLNGQSFAQTLAAYETEQNSASWAVDRDFRPENRNLIKVVGSVPLKLGSHTVVIKVAVTWNKSSKSAAAVQSHFGRLTDFGAGFAEIMSLPPEKKQIAVSSMMWFTTYNMMRTISSEKLSSDDEVKAVLEELNSSRDENDKVLLPW